MTLVQAFLLPVIIHALYTAILGVRMAKARVAAVRGGKARLKDIALSPATWPDDVKKLGNNFDNQFDLPTTWYAATALVLVTAKLDLVFVILSWVFLALRLWHSLIHTGSNKLPGRMYVYASGLVTVSLIWLWFAWRLFVAA